MRRAASIGCILKVVLAGAAGCGRTPTLPASSGAVPGTGQIPRPTAVGNDAGAEASAAPALDASTAPTAVLDAPTAVLDAPTAVLDAPTAVLDAPTAVLDAPTTVLDADTDAPQDLPGSRYRVLQLAVGRTHNCALLDNHQIKCWGDNGSGQLGLADQMSRGSDPATMGNALPFVDLGTGRTAKSVAAGRYATCAILDDDELECWGVSFLAGPNQTGGNLHPVELGAGRKPLAVAIGFTQTCAALDDGSFLCWSGPSTKVAAAADGARVVQLAQDEQTIGLFDDGSVRRIDISMPGGPTPPIDFGGPAAFVAGASTMGRFDCVVLRAGGTACTPTGSSPIVPADAAVVALAITEYQHACGLDSAGVVTCWNIQAHPEWGDATNGNTVRAPLGQPSVDIGAGDYHGCALLADGSVKCWDIDATPDPVPEALGGSVSTSAGWPAVDLGTRPAP